EVNTQLDLQNDNVAKKEYNTVSFTKKKDVDHPIDKQEFTIQHLNQWVQLSKNEKIGLFILDDTMEIVDNEYVLFIDEEKLHLPLTIRHRQPGDRMRYVGLNGSKKIKDIFIDDKTPIKQRDQAWIVEDCLGAIIWLVTYRKMSLFTAQETDKLTYILKYKKD
ncbi:MAG TPA: tRNA lysidine(34) synthetase TilS, partial [Atopostipes sp.]|nr:tRNA lysidine(34) synthetase TilS [Atopostipes sp.]